VGRHLVVLEDSDHSRFFKVTTIDWLLISYGGGGGRGLVF